MRPDQRGLRIRPSRIAASAVTCALACIVARWTPAHAMGGGGAVIVPSDQRTNATSPHSPLRYDMDYPTIGYGNPPRHNPIVRLQERLARGEIRLEFKPPRGYLDSLLAALAIDPSSQVLVFSKTSLQIDRISAATPRAIYFNDDSYVAWVRGSELLELSVMDDELGAVFYTLSNSEAAAPTLERQTSRCLTCHDTYSMTGGGVPRFLISSTPVDTNGVALEDQISHETDDQTPLAERWGGWYVTGVPDREAHLGNLQIPPGQGLALRRAHRPGTLASIGRLFDAAPYLTDKSDIVALLVLEHQVEVKNLITRLNFKARSFLARDAASGTPEPVTFATASPRTQASIRTMVEQVVRVMLFQNAAAYRGKLAGNSGFDRWFDAQGPRDPTGRSLRDFDLHKRLFRYPLSYVIYSEAFDALPPYVKGSIYARLREILTGQDHDAEFSYLSEADRVAVLEILTATKPDFAAAAATLQGTSHRETALRNATVSTHASTLPGGKDDSLTTTVSVAGST